MSDNLTRPALDLSTPQRARPGLIKTPRTLWPEVEVASKAAGWTREFLPRGKTFLGIEFDRNLIKFIRVTGPSLTEDVRFLKVKFLSENTDEEIHRVLREQMDEMGLKPGAHATISIPRHRVHAKVLRLPSHDTAELRQMAFFHLSNEMPIDTQQVVYDVRVVGRDEDGFARVMVVVAHKHEIRNYLDFCDRAGIIVDEVRLNIEAIYHSFLLFLKDLPELQSKCMALVDVDFSATNVIIINRDTLLFCRSVGRGVEDLMERMVGPQRQAEYDNWIDELSTGITDTIAVFNETESQPAVEHIALTGWLPRAENLTRSMEKCTGLPVTWFDLTMPLGHLDTSTNKATRQHWFSISTLLGMAGAREHELMNLLPDQEQKKRRRQNVTRRVVHAGFVVLYLVGMAAGALWYAGEQRLQLQSHLTEKVLALQPGVQTINTKKQAEKRLEEQLISTTPTAFLLAQLLEKLPPGVELRSVTFVRGEKFLVHGIASNLADVFNLPSTLATQTNLGEAVIISADKRQTRAQKQQIEFEMQVRLQKQSQAAEDGK